MKCLVCGRTQDIYGQLRFLVIDEPAPVKLDLSLCNCGFGYYRHNQISKIYKENSKYVNSNTGSGAAIEYDIIRLERTFANVAPHIKSTDRILDIGCNNGTFLSILYKNGFTNLTGTDFAINRSYTAGLEQQGVKIYEATSLKGIDAEGKFDVVTVNHVLEHVDGIAGFIAEIREVLKDDGMLYVEVPDSSRYLANYFQPFSYFDLEHINHFSLDNLSLFLLRNGFEVIDSFEFDIAMSPSIYYPGTGVVAKKKAQAENNVAVNETYASRKKIEAYYQKSLDEISNYSYKGSFDNVVLYGVGANTLRTLGMLDKDIENVKYFADKNPLFHGRMVLGKEIKSVDFLAADPSQPDIIIFSKLYYHDIVNDLQKKGMTNSVFSFF